MFAEKGTRELYPGFCLANPRNQANRREISINAACSRV